MPVRLLICGGGRMGGALVGGLLAHRWGDASDIAVVEPVAERRAALSLEYEGLVTLVAPEPGVVGDGGGAVLAVKPDVAEPACRALGEAGVRRVLSIVAGMPTQRLEGALPEGCVVVRAMPNTPALVGAGVSAMAGGRRAEAGDLQWAEDVLAAVGRVVRLPERDLDAVTALSGSGPAYFFLVAEALVEAGMAVGLSRDVCSVLVTETLFGSAKLLTETGEPPEALRAAVTSPGGTTEAGLQALEARAVRAAFAEAVAAAAERSRSLGR